MLSLFPCSLISSCLLSWLFSIFIFPHIVSCSFSVHALSFLPHWLCLSLYSVLFFCPRLSLSGSEHVVWDHRGVLGPRGWGSSLSRLRRGARATGAAPHQHFSPRWHSHRRHYGDKRGLSTQRIQPMTRREQCVTSHGRGKIMHSSELLVRNPWWLYWILGRLRSPALDLTIYVLVSAALRVRVCVWKLNKRTSGDTLSHF